MIWPTIIFNNTEEEIPKGYFKDGNRLIKLYNPYVNEEPPSHPKEQTIMKKKTMTKNLISLEEHNKKALQINETDGNGIACPNCGSELFDRGVSLISYPPQYLTFCKNCNYKGSRY